MDNKRLFIKLNIVKGEGLTTSNLSSNTGPLRKSQRQHFLLPGNICSFNISIHHCTTKPIQDFPDMQITFCYCGCFCDWNTSRSQCGLFIEHGLGYGDRSFDICEVVRSIQRPIRAFAKAQILQVLDYFRLCGGKNYKYTRSDVANSVVNNSTLVQYPPIFAWAKDLCQGIRCCMGSVHTTDVGNKADSIGNSRHLDHGFCAINKGSEHFGAHLLAASLLHQLLRSSCAIK